jgi:hypothetical protein
VALDGVLAMDCVPSRVPWSSGRILRAPTRARAHFVLVLGREVLLERGVNDGNHGSLPGERRLARVSCDPSLAAG